MQTPEEKLRLVWFSHFVPYPPRGGHLQRSYNLIHEISKKYPVTLVAFNQQRESSSVLENSRRELLRFCNEVVLWEMPIPWRGLRWSVQMPFAGFLRDPYSSRCYWSEASNAQFMTIMREARSDKSLVHFDSIDLALYAASTPGPKVVNHHNCESEMMRRRAEHLRAGFKRGLIQGQAEKLGSLERRVCHKFNVNLTVSERDARVLAAINQKAHIHVVANATDPEYFSCKEDGQRPFSAIFAAAFDWYPNLSGAEYLLKRIWPLVRRAVPGAALTLAGKRPPRSLYRLVEDKAEVRICADPEDIRPLIRNSQVVVCPVTEGGGTRLKILDALAMGKPVVSTPEACEGLNLDAGRHLLVARSPEDFAEMIARLWSDDDLRRTLGRAGRTVIEHEYSWTVSAEQLRLAYNCALGSHCA